MKVGFDHWDGFGLFGGKEDRLLDSTYDAAGSDFVLS